MYSFCTKNSEIKKENYAILTKTEDGSIIEKRPTTRVGLLKTYYVFSKQTQ